jgi:hypothetical protein
MADMDLEKQATKRKRNEVNYEEGYGEEHGEEYEDEYGEDDEEDYEDPDQGEFEEGQSDEMIVRPTIPAPEGMRGDTARVSHSQQAVQTWPLICLDSTIATCPISSTW